MTERKHCGCGCCDHDCACRCCEAVAAWLEAMGEHQAAAVWRDHHPTPPAQAPAAAQAQEVQAVAWHVFSDEGALVGCFDGQSQMLQRHRQERPHALRAVYYRQPTVFSADDPEIIAAFTRAVRHADQDFEAIGGSSRHWVRDCFLPRLMEEPLFAHAQPLPPGQCKSCPHPLARHSCDIGGCLCGVYAQPAEQPSQPDALDQLMSDALATMTEAVARLHAAQHGSGNWKECVRGVCEAARGIVGRALTIAADMDEHSQPDADAVRRLEESALVARNLGRAISLMLQRNEEIGRVRKISLVMKADGIVEVLDKALAALRGKGCPVIDCHLRGEHTHAVNGPEKASR